MSKTITLPDAIAEMLQQNMNVIARIQDQNQALLTGYMAGAGLDKTKTYTLSDDCKALIIDKEK